MRLSVMDGIRWGEQAANDAVSWVESTTKQPTATELVAFRAGHETGWRDCLATLSLHGIIQRFDKPAERAQGGGR